MVATHHDSDAIVHHLLRAKADVNVVVEVGFVTVEIAEFKVTAAGRSHGTNDCLSSEQPESSYYPSKCRSQPKCLQ